MYNTKGVRESLPPQRIYPLYTGICKALGTHAASLKQVFLTNQMYIGNWHTGNMGYINMVCIQPVPLATHTDWTFLRQRSRVTGRILQISHSREIFITPRINVIQFPVSLCTVFNSNNQQMYASIHTNTKAMQMERIFSLEKSPDNKQVMESLKIVHKTENYMELWTAFMHECVQSAQYLDLLRAIYKCLDSANNSMQTMM